MAITLDDFDKVWASQSPLTPYSFSDANYQEGWNFVGATPPARQMWDYIQKQNDEKMQYLANNYLPLSGGTMTGPITTKSGIIAKSVDESSTVNLYGGTGYDGGATVILNGKSASNAGQFNIGAYDGTNRKNLNGKPDGTLTWDGIGMCGTSIGSAGQSGATLTLPKNGTYLIVVAHNSVSALNGIFIARGWSDGGMAYKLAGAANVTLTCSKNKITVTTTGGTVGVYYIYLG